MLQFYSYIFRPSVNNSVNDEQLRFVFVIRRRFIIG